MIGINSIAVITNSSASFLEVFCFFQDADVPWNQQPPLEIGLKIGAAVGILVNLPKLTVSLVASALFYSFAVVAYVRFYIAAFLSMMRCQAQMELSQQEKVSLEKTAPKVLHTCNTQNT